MEKLDLNPFWKTATPSVNGTIATFDLSSANTFTFDTSSNIDRFELVNIPDDSTTFTIRIKNPSDYDIDIDSFSVGGLAIPVYWPRGVVPEVSDSTDIYSFKIFDGSDVVNDGIYGVVGGQLFSGHGFPRIKTELDLNGQSLLLSNQLMLLLLVSGRI